MLYAVPRTIPAGHSDIVGVVCIASDGATGCPGTPALLNSTVTLPPPQLRVAVAISNSAGLFGFDIILHANSSILKPAGFDLSNTILKGTQQTRQVLAECLSGNAVRGTCDPQATSVDTLELSAASALGQSNTVAPTTGQLFTAIYNITRQARNIPIGFQTGCNTHPESLPGVCVQVSAIGTTFPIPETIQAAKFTNLDYFDLQDSGVGSLSIDQGSFSTLQLNVTSIDNFSGNVTLAINITPSGPTVTLNATSVIVNPTTPHFIAANVSIAKSLRPINYTITFTATSPTFPSYPPNTLSVVVTVISVIPDFDIKVNPNPVQLNVTTSNSTVISLTPFDKFAGIVNLTISAVPSTIRYSLTSNRINMTGGSSNSTVLVVNSTISGHYDLNVTGTSGTLQHSQIIIVTVADFAVRADVATLPVNKGKSATESLEVGSLFPIHTTVMLGRPLVTETNSTGTYSPSSGIAAACSPTVIGIDGSGLSLSLPTCVVNGTVVGFYTVSLVATSGPISHAVTFNVQVLGPDFTITAQPPIVTVAVGGTASVNVTLIRQQGLNDTIKFNPKFLSIPGSPPSVSLNATSIILNSTKPGATLLVTFTSTAKSPTGVYTFNLGASASKVSHQVVITVVVTATTSPHYLVVDSVTATPTSATTGSTVTITIVVKNLGSATENSTILALAGDISVANETFTNLAPGNNVTVTLTWNTSGFNPGPYSIGGQVLGVPGQTNLQNNIARMSQPVTLAAANTNILQSPYLQPGIIATLIVLMAIMALLVLQARRKTPTPSA